MTMRTLLSALFICLIAGSAVQAQNTTPRTSTGDMALNFSINGFGNFGVTGPLVAVVPWGGDTTLQQLASMLGTQLVQPIFGVGGTMFVSDNMAVRFGIGFNTSTTSTKRSQTSDTSDTETRSSFAIAPAFLYHFATAGPVTVYTGAEIQFGTASTTSGFTNATDSMITGKSQTGFGAGVIIGAQFFPWSNISLGAESQFGVTLASQSEDTGPTTNDLPSTTTIGFTLPFSVRLGIYF